MRVFIAVLVLIFSLQSWTKADDIRDFQIEGMSIGDSLLDFYSKDEINSFKIIPYKDDKITAYNVKINLDIYEEIQIAFVTNDKKKKIVALEAIIDYPNNIDNCHVKIKDIYEEIKTILLDYDDLGLETNPLRNKKGTFTDYLLMTKEKDEIQIACYDYEKSTPIDHLRVAIRNYEYRKWLQNEAYK